MDKKYWTKTEKDLWEKWKNKPKEKLLKIIFRIMLDNVSEAEPFTIVEACKKQLGLKYEIPNCYSKKEWLNDGWNENELIEVEKQN